VVEATLNRAFCSGVPEISKRNQRVAFQTGPAGAAKRGAGEADVECIVGLGQQFIKVNPGIPGEKVVLVGVGWRGVVRAHFLAHVASEDPPPEAGEQIHRSEFACLDRPIRDAPSGIEDVGPHECPRGTRLQAPRAFSTMVAGDRWVWLDVGVDEQHREKKVRGARRDDLQAIFAGKSKAGRLRPGSLERWGRIDAAPVANARGAEGRPQLFEALPDEVVVVSSPRVPSDSASSTTRIWRGPMVVFDREYDHPAGGGEAKPGVGADVVRGSEPMQIGMQALVHPLLEGVESRRRSEAREADRAEAAGGGVAGDEVARGGGQEASRGSVALTVWGPPGSTSAVRRAKLP
jgi:hypothetical protein